MRSMAAVPQAFWFTGGTPKQVRKDVDRTVDAATEGGRGSDPRRLQRAQPRLRRLLGRRRPPLRPLDRRLRRRHRGPPGGRDRRAGRARLGLREAQAPQARREAAAPAAPGGGLRRRRALALAARQDHGEPPEARSAPDAFALNVSNFRATDELVAYGTEHRPCHFVIDTSRNGQGPKGTRWCNPPGRGLGAPAHHRDRQPARRRLPLDQDPGRVRRRVPQGPKAGAGGRATRSASPAAPTRPWASPPGGGQPYGKRPRAAARPAHRPQRAQRAVQARRKTTRRAAGRNAAARRQRSITASSHQRRASPSRGRRRGCARDRRRAAAGRRPPRAGPAGSRAVKRASSPASSSPSKASEIVTRGASVLKCTSRSEPSASTSTTSSSSSPPRCTDSGRIPTTTSSSTQPRDRPGVQRLVGEDEALAAQHYLHLAVHQFQVPPQQVHGRRADEGRHEEVGRAVVELLRRVDLLQLPVAHDRDAVAHRHRLGLVVRDVQRRGAELLVQPRDVRAHLHPQLGVQVRQRLVHQERLRLAHDRPPQRDPLALAAAQLRAAAARAAR